MIQRNPPDEEGIKLGLADKTSDRIIWVCKIATALFIVFVFFILIAQYIDWLQKN